MKRTLKNIEMVTMINMLAKYEDNKLPQKISYAIFDNLTNLREEYSKYEKQLSKITNSYSEHFIKDENNEIIYHQGVPTVDDSVKDEYYEQINDLLGIEVEVDFRYIDKSIFDYDDKGVYDILSARDMRLLQTLLCEDKNEEE